MSRRVDRTLVVDDVEPLGAQPGEVVAQGDWYEYEAKYSDGGMELVAPAPISAEQAARLEELALAAFRLGGCSGLARCDFFVEPDGEVLVNEVNTMPGFTPTSMFPRMWAASGVDYSDLVDTLLRAALARPVGLR